MHLQECQESVCIAAKLNICLDHRPFRCPGQALHGGCSSCSSQDLGGMILHRLRSDRYRSSKVLKKARSKGWDNMPIQGPWLAKAEHLCLTFKIKAASLAAILKSLTSVLTEAQHQKCERYLVTVSFQGSLDKLDDSQNETKISDALWCQKR